MNKKTLVSEIGRAITGLIALSLLLCLIYPLAVWAIAQLVFLDKAGGSPVKKENRVIGSVLIGQPFSGPGFFHPRPSAAGQGYDARASGGSNLGPLSRSLVEQVKNRLKVYRQENNLPPQTPVPIDAVTASASGLDPHISVPNARLQAGRVATARGIGREKVLAAIAACTEDRQLGIFGEKRVNVLLLNLELQKVK